MFIRDSNGSLVPQEMELKLLRKTEKQADGTLKVLEAGPTILAMPIRKEEYLALLSADLKGDRDAELISKYIVEPKYTFDEAKALRYDYSKAIARAIVDYSIGTKEEGENEFRR